MKIIVVIKRVPDTETQVKVGSCGTCIDPSGIVYVMNPYDEYAVEEAVRLKEKFGGDITILCLGPEEATKEIRTAIAMGADTGILLKDQDGILDPSGIAKAIAAEIKTIQYDIILFGKKNVDDDFSQIPALVAARLDLPIVAGINEITVNADAASANCKRNVEGGTESYEVKLPAIFTAEKGLNEPRYPNLIAVRKSMKAPLDIKDIAADPKVMRVVKMELPPKRQGGKIVGKGVEAVPALLKLLREEAKII